MKVKRNVLFLLGAYLIFATVSQAIASNTFVNTISCGQRDEGKPGLWAIILLETSPSGFKHQAGVATAQVYNSENGNCYGVYPVSDVENGTSRTFKAMNSKFTFNLVIQKSTSDPMRVFDHKIYIASLSALTTPSWDPTGRSREVNPAAVEWQCEEITPINSEDSFFWNNRE